MMKLTKEEQHRQCIKEIKATLLIYMFFMACANRVPAKWHRVDGIPYAGVVCGLGAWNSGACGNRCILAA